MSTSELAAPLATVPGSASVVFLSPWLLFSGRWPWVRTPGWSTFVVNGSRPPGPSYIHTTPRPIDSYQDARVVSYVALTFRMSPGLTATAQFGRVAVIDTSQDTAPAGS